MMTSFFGHPISVWDVVSSLLYLVICVVGLLGNLLAIYVIVKYTRMKTVTNQYILNLSISDAIFLLDLPLIIVGGLLKRWIFGVVLCKVYFATTGINMFTGSFTLAVLSGDRYLAVCHPSKAVVYRTARNARIVILLTWVVSVLFLTPIIVYANIFPQVSPNVTSFSPNSSTLFTPTLESLSRNNEQQHLKRFHRNIVATSQQQQQLQHQSFTVEKLFLKKQLLFSKELFQNESFEAEEKVLAEIIAKLKAALKDQGLKYEEIKTSANLPRDVVKTFGVHSDEEQLRKPMKYIRKRDAIEDEVSEVSEVPTTAPSPTTSETASSTEQEGSQTRYTCTVNWPQDYVIPAVHAYIIYNMVIGFVMPVMVISILYTTLVVKLSKDPNQAKVSEEGNKKASFVKTVKKTFLSKESSFGKKSNSFGGRKSPSPKTPTIHENEILSYETPPEILNSIGTRIFSDTIETTTAEGRSDRISMITRQITAASDSVVAARPPPPVIRNLSAFKQRKLQQPRITRLVTTIILVYVVCWLPYWAFQLHLLTNVHAIRESRWKLTLYHIFTILSYCNSAINPILYVFTNQNFRDSFVGAVQCREDMGTRARRATDQFKDSVRMRNIAARNSPKTPTGTQCTQHKLNGSKRKNLQRFHSCSPNIIRSRGNNNNNNLDIAKPLNNMTFKVNQHDNVDSKSLKPLVEKIADKIDDQIFETAELKPINNNNNKKPFHDNNESGLRPSNNNNNSPVVDCPISEVANCIQTTDR